MLSSLRAGSSNLRDVSFWSAARNVANVLDQGHASFLEMGKEPNLGGIENDQAFSAAASASSATSTI